jgi:hypothetical protein
MERAQPISRDAHAHPHAPILHAVHAMSQQFMHCHRFMAEQTHRLTELLRAADSRGILLHEAIALADVGYWLQHIDWQTKFLKAVLAFAQDPSRTTLRPLIELYGRDRERMRVDPETLVRQLEHRLATFAQPGDAQVRKAIMKNRKRVLAVYLHVRTGYGGAALARIFKVPRSTPNGWLAWFDSLPEGLRAGILAFMATQTPMMATGLDAITSGVAATPLRTTIRPYWKPHPPANGQT